MTTNLLIFAPSNLRRLAWQALLENQPGIVLHSANSQMAHIAGSLPPSPSVVLADIPNVQTKFVSELRATIPDCGLLFLVESYDLDEIIRLLRAGATGFIAHDSTIGELARGIIAAGRGEIVLPQELATKVLVALARGEADNMKSPVSLTEREQEVLTFLARGYMNKDIAQTLFLSVRTVEAHLRNIYSKLNVASRTEAALWAVNHGYGSQE